MISIPITLPLMVTDAAERPGSPAPVPISRTLLDGSILANSIIFFDWVMPIHYKAIPFFPSYRCLIPKNSLFDN